MTLFLWKFVFILSSKTYHSHSVYSPSQNPTGCLSSISRLLKLLMWKSLLRMCNVWALLPYSLTHICEASIQSYYSFSCCHKWSCLFLLVGGGGEKGNFPTLMFLLYLIHSADPQSRPVVIIASAHVVHPSVRPHFSKSSKTNQNSSAKQCSLLARQWVWPGGSLMFLLFSFSEAKRRF